MKRISFLLILILLFGLTWCANAQAFKPAVQDEAPYFVGHKALPTDSLFRRDVAILTYFGRFEGVDTTFLKPAVLAAMALEQVRNGKPATFRTVLDYFSSYKTTYAYKEFIEGLSIYKILSGQKVNVQNWEQDKRLFERLGFTDNDLDDFKAYISQPAHADYTYKQAYMAYMKEIEALGPKKEK